MTLIHYYTDTSTRNANRAEQDAPETLTTPEGIEFRQALNHYLTNRAVYRDESGRWQIADRYTSVSLVDYDNAALVTRFERMVDALACVDSRNQEGTNPMHDNEEIYDAFPSDPDAFVSQAWKEASREAASDPTCHYCGNERESHAEDCPEYEPEPESTHFHVVAFINGCLNDYDSGPYDSRKDARHECRELAYSYFGDGTYTEQWSADEYRVRRTPKSHGEYIIAVEECTRDRDECEAATY